MTYSAYSVISAFVARLAQLGVTNVVVSPGSRSTPLTLCFDAQPDFTTWVQLDERSAGFFALGLGRSTGVPAVLVCTSGTAAANYLPAVVEAYHAGVPMIVCTADRPPEMRGWGSNQTIDQVGLYGTHVRLAHDMAVADEMTQATAVRWADLATQASTLPDPGPVHLNWPLREPLEPPDTPALTSEQSVRSHRTVDNRTVCKCLEPSELALESFKLAVEPARQSAICADASEAMPVRLAAALLEFAELTATYERGVIVVGPWPGGGFHQERLWALKTLRLAAWTSWPIIGEPFTSIRDEALHMDVNCVVPTATHLLACEAFGDRMRPDVAVMVGRVATTKPVRLWLERTRPAHVIQIDPENRWERAVFRLTGHLPAPIDVVCDYITSVESVEVESTESGVVASAASNRCMSSRLSSRLSSRIGSRLNDRPNDWLASWRRADTAARKALMETVHAGPLLSAQTVCTLVDALPEGAVLMSSNSMPVRDMDSYVTSVRSLQCTSNRGTAGIDGVVSTALGIAATDTHRATVLHIGDIALLHDLGGLTAARRFNLQLTVVCVDNGGGEIFSLLPIADRIDSEDFIRLFHTPHDVCFTALDGFGGIRAHTVTTTAELEVAIASSLKTRAPGIDLIVVPINKDDDVTQRHALTAAAQIAVAQTDDGQTVPAQATAARTAHTAATAHQAATAHTAAAFNADEADSLSIS